MKYKVGDILRYTNGFEVEIIQEVLGGYNLIVTNDSNRLNTIKPGIMLTTDLNYFDINGWTLMNKKKIDPRPSWF